jgi:hypothetical protein
LSGVFLTLSQEEFEDFFEDQQGLGRQQSDHSLVEGEVRGVQQPRLHAQDEHDPHVQGLARAAAP